MENGHSKPLTKSQASKAGLRIRPGAQPVDHLHLGRRIITDDWQQRDQYEYQPVVDFSLIVAFPKPGVYEIVEKKIPVYDADDALPPKGMPKTKNVITWLRQLTSDVQYGKKYKGKPIMCPRNDQVEAFLNHRGKWLQKLRNRDYCDHFTGQETYYFQGTGRFNRYTLLAIDIDCHSPGTRLEDAIAAAKYLQRLWGTKLYYEVSTNGNGIHAYFVLDKQVNGRVLEGKMLKNYLLDPLEEHLADVDKLFDVDAIELKGTPATITWQNDELHYRAGTLCKLPRVDNEAALMDTLVIDSDFVWNLPVGDDLPKPEVAKRDAEKPVRTTERRSSLGECFFNQDDADRLKQFLRKSRRLILNDPVLCHSILGETKRLGKARSTITEALGIFCFLFDWLCREENRNADGSMPTDRFVGLWKALYAAGFLTQSIDGKSFAFVRNLADKLGLIKWVDVHYVVGQPRNVENRQKGQAAKWQSSEQFVAIFGEKRTKKDQEEGIEVHPLKEVLTQPVCAGYIIVAPVSRFDWPRAREGLVALGLMAA